MEQEDVTLSEISQKQKDKDYMITLTCDTPVIKFMKSKTRKVVTGGDGEKWEVTSQQA